ncbi:T9SS-dependent choice-of-anchor J family protein [Cochleicola gelatinilyticus]|uniref:Secretion system C-terminal sorting domain-containing protein n=1 Tax=Cochleicola gelatinilyticus TaxID=1763537 RepID=A0A167EZR3_9FLAO|nr:choice-of-anchor J domain-containing protein [Cochleicola gelatinilyticus]OAB76045.1 hypothetical protein ULVI_13365 [Cochleicola gelatinilyticus]
MKKITFFAAAMFAAFTLNAQEVLFEDNFDDEDISDWTLYDEDGDGNQFGDQFVITDADSNPVTPVSLISRSWIGSPLFPDNWAVSPGFDIPEGSGALVTWVVQCAAAEWDNEKYSVYVGTSSDIADLVNSETVFTETYDDPNDAGTVYERELEIQDFAGETVYLAFRHYDSTDEDFISIDDLLVTSATLSVEDQTFANFSHFLSNGNLSLRAGTAMDNVQLHNILGQQVISKELNNSNETVNISSLKSGVYIATVTIEGAKKSFKIVKN